MFRLNFPDASQENINRSATVARVVELVSLRMTKGEFGASQVTPTKSRKNAAELPPYQFEITSRFDEKENQLEVSIVIRGRDIRNATGEGAGTDGLRVDAGFLLTYQLMVEPPPVDLRADLFSAFAKVNGLMNIWPYYREFSHEVARRMGFPAVLVPLLRVEPAGAKTKQGKAAPKKSPKSVTRKPKAKG
jgi:hypothetical protein